MCGDVSAAEEGRIAAVARAVAPVSSGVRTQLCNAAKELAKQGGFDRDLYATGLRVGLDANDGKLPGIVATALRTDEFGGLATLAACAQLDEPALGAPLARAAMSPKTQFAVAAEVARACRGEGVGPRLSALAPRVKEAHRIALTIQVLLPLAASSDRPAPAACANVADAMMILAGSERHLGRWLVLAQLAHRGRDPRPLRDAVERTKTGPDSSRAAWTLVAWSLDPSRGTGSTRPTSELVARMSHRPSADRDASFLFRLAEAKVDGARPMLEALVRTRALGEELAVRAAAALVEFYEPVDVARALLDDAARSGRPEVRGLAAALAWDHGDAARAASLAQGLASAEELPALAWASLVQAAAASTADKRPARLVTESAYRRIQHGWPE